LIDLADGHTNKLKQKDDFLGGGSKTQI